MNILRWKTQNLKDIGVLHEIEIRKTLRTMMLVKNLAEKFGLPEDLFNIGYHGFDLFRRFFH